MFEFWPGWLFYIPVVLYWIILGLRYRSFTLPTAANPRVETGGLCGERKTTVLDQVGNAARSWIAPYTTMVTDMDDIETAMRLMRNAGLGFPIVVKPNVGCNGTGVRLVRTRSSLETVLALFPRDVELVLQELIDLPGEAGIFFIRHPDDSTGSVTSLTLKRPPVVIGDGQATLRELILADNRFRQAPDIYLPRLAGRLDDVLARGEQFQLVFAGNHCKGSMFVDGNAEITRSLASRINQIMVAIPDFHFGRLDVKFASTSSLRAGEDFRIIEINGVGSEATHIWDPNTSLVAAYRDQFRHYRHAFQIGAQMRRAGFKPTSGRELLSFWRKQRRLMSSYPMND